MNQRKQRTYESQILPNTGVCRELSQPRNSDKFLDFQADNKGSLMSQKVPNREKE